VCKVTGKSVQTVAIKETDRPGQSLNNNELRIYKPQVERNASASGQPPAPKKVTNLKDVKPVASSSPKDVTPSKEVKPASTQSKDQSKAPATTPNVVNDKQQPQHANPMNDNKKQQKPQPHKPNPKEAKVTNQVHSDEALAFTNGNLVDRSIPGNTVANPVQYDLREPVQDQKQNQFKNLRNARKGGK